MRVIALAVLLAACGGSSKPPAPAHAENVVKEEPPPPEEEHVVPEDDPEPPATPPVDQASVDAGGTGAAVCDELIARINCLNQKLPDVPAEEVQAFQDAVVLWKQYLLDDATRQAVIDACKMSLDAGKDGFDAQGC